MADYETLNVCPVPYCQQCVKCCGDTVTQLHFITICNVFSYLRHVKRLGICLPRGRSRSIINIH